jgi:hypothetical protein
MGSNRSDRSGSSDRSHQRDEAAESQQHILEAGQRDAAARPDRPAKQGERQQNDRAAGSAASRPRERNEEEDRIDEASRESFPASDPPSIP